MQRITWLNDFNQVSLKNLDLNRRVRKEVAYGEKITTTTQRPKFGDNPLFLPVGTTPQSFLDQSLNFVFQHVICQTDTDPAGEEYDRVERTTGDDWMAWNKLGDNIDRMWKEAFVSRVGQIDDANGISVGLSYLIALAPIADFYEKKWKEEKGKGDQIDHIKFYSPVSFLNSRFKNARLIFACADIQQCNFEEIGQLTRDNFIKIVKPRFIEAHLSAEIVDDLLKRLNPFDILVSRKLNTELLNFAKNWSINIDIDQAFKAIGALMHIKRDNSSAMPFISFVAKVLQAGVESWQPNKMIYTIVICWFWLIELLELGTEGGSKLAQAQLVGLIIRHVVQCGYVKQRESIGECDYDIGLLFESKAQGMQKLAIKPPIGQYGEPSEVLDWFKVLAWDRSRSGEQHKASSSGKQRGSRSRDELRGSRRREKQPRSVSQTRIWSIVMKVATNVLSFAGAEESAVYEELDAKEILDLTEEGLMSHSIDPFGAYLADIRMDKWQACASKVFEQRRWQR